MDRMELRHVRMERDGDVAVITLDNPGRRNALSRDMQQGLGTLIDELGATPAIRAVLLTAAGNAFCAGADLAGNAIPAGQEHLSRGQATQLVMEELSNPIITGLRELPVPVVTALPGVVAGAGIGIALAADVVIAARSAYFYLPFIPKLGIVPDLGTTWFLQQLVGRGRAHTAGRAPGRGQGGAMGRRVGVRGRRNPAGRGDESRAPAGQTARACRAGDAPRL